MNKVKEVVSERLGEKYYEIDHSSGLKIAVYPKEGYTSSYVIFGTKYGSIDTVFRLGDDEEFTRVPEGIAHFLEHKLFESEELDAFERYSETGASANAYTSFDRTCYLFSCSDRLKENLEILMDFVTHPYFTQATVQKEQGIIGQEIKMTEDDPTWAILFSLLSAMYRQHPVQIEIAGTVESISHITADLLYKCYDTFYNLENMFFCAVGNVDVDTVLEVADRVLVKKPAVKIERKFFDEPAEVNTHYTEKTMAVVSPMFALGFKENISTPERSAREVILSQMLTDIICGDTTKLYNDMLTEGLINRNFGTEYFFGYGYSAYLFSGESEKYGEIADRVKAEIVRLQREGIDEEDFERVRRMNYGRILMSYDDIDDIANNAMLSHFAGENMFDDIEILSDITLGEINDRLRKSINVENSALSVIKPKED